MNIAQIVNLLYKISAAMDTAIVTYFLKTGNAMDFNSFEFLFTVGSFLIRRIALVIFNKRIDL